jgi:magnesium-transporting ATPase (P-type)
MDLCHFREGKVDEISSHVRAMAEEGIRVLGVAMGGRGTDMAREASALVLLPVHVVFLELIIDPACSVVFEGEKRKPM